MSDGNGELPPGWVQTELGQLGMIRARNVVPADEPDKRWELWSVPSFATEEPELILGSDVGSSKQRVEPGDVLLCKINPRLNRVWRVTERQEYEQIASSEWIVIRNSEVDPNFLMHRLRERRFREHLCSDVSGIGGSLTRARPEIVKKIKISLPPLNEQRRIVAKVEALQERSRRVREALEEVGPLLEQFRQSVLAAAFRGDLTADWRAKHPDAEPASELLARIRTERRRRWEEAELAKYEAKGKQPPKGWRDTYDEPTPVDGSTLPAIPGGWCWTSIETLTCFGPQNGLYVPKKQYGRGTPILRIEDYQQTWSRSAGELQRVDIHPETIENYSLRIGDLVINRVNSPSHLGKSLVISARHVPAVFESNMMRLAMASETITYFLNDYLSSPAGKRALTANAKWAVNQASINQGDVNSTPIPLPPQQEQAAILDRLRAATESAQVTLASVAECRAAVVSLDQSILAKAFRGELVPQDAGDEPAAVLLERIRAERAAAGGKRKAAGRGRSRATSKKAGRNGRGSRHDDAET